MSGSLRQMRTDLGKGGQTGTQTGQFVDETRSKSHISPALQSYWTLRLPGLHRALWMRPQSGDRRVWGCNRSSPTVLLRRLDYCFQKLFSKTNAFEGKKKKVM